MNLTIERICLMWIVASIRAVQGAFHPASATATLQRTIAQRTIASRSVLKSQSLTEEEELHKLTTGYARPTVHWYPGHIAKAERMLSETLKAVDVVVEVRDARACKASSHQKVAEWCAGRPRIVVLTHVDQVPKLSIAAWKRSYEVLGAARWDGKVNAQVLNQANQNRKRNASPRNKQDYTVSPVENVLFVNAKQGQGIHALHRTIFKAGAHVQERRERRGLKERALRVGIIGYPNVGKSALINRILGRRRAKTANIPGVTRSLQWIRVKQDELKTSKSKTFELLDSPGVIPAKMVDQSDAILLAACNCIGDAAYDNQGVAAYLFDHIKALHLMDMGGTCAPEWRQRCQERYKFDPLCSVEDYTGEDMLYKVAEFQCRGNLEDASRKMLQDFRTGRLGLICLQIAPQTKEDEGQVKVTIGGKSASQVDNEEGQYNDGQEARMARAAAALETAKQQGLELPPIVVQESDVVETKDQQVGKGLFDGW